MKSLKLNPAYYQAHLRTLSKAQLLDEHCNCVLLRARRDLSAIEQVNTLQLLEAIAAQAVTPELRDSALSTAHQLRQSWVA